MDGDRQLPALTQQQNATLSASKLCSPGLKKLLIEADDSGGACRIIALNAKLRAECHDLLPMLEAQKAPATAEQTLEVVMRRMVAYGVTANLAFSHGVTWESYVAGLEGLPIHAIEDAFDRWDRGEGVKDIVAAGFPPRPPQVALLAQQAKQEIFTAAYRARKALDHVEKTGAEWTHERKAAEKAKMIELGYLNPDGTANLNGFSLKGMPQPEKPRWTPHELAERLRQSDAQARQGGAPINRGHIEADPGDVI